MYNMQPIPQRRRQPMPPRSRGYAQPAPVAPPPPVMTMVHTVMQPARGIPATHYAPRPVNNGYPARTFVTIQTVAGPVAMPVTVGPAAYSGVPVAQPYPVAAGMQPGGPMGGRPGMVRRPPYGAGPPMGQGPPVHYRRVIGRRR